MPWRRVRYDNSAGSVTWAPGDCTQRMVSAIGWKWARKWTVDLRARIGTWDGSTPTWRNISWSTAWMRRQASTAETPLSASVKSAIGPMRNLAPAYIGRGPGEV